MKFITIIEIISYSVMMINIFFSSFNNAKVLKTSNKIAEKYPNSKKTVKVGLFIEGAITKNSLVMKKHRRLLRLYLIIIVIFALYAIFAHFLDDIYIYVGLVSQVVLLIIQIRIVVFAIKFAK